MRRSLAPLLLFALPAALPAQWHLAPAPTLAIEATAADGTPRIGQLVAATRFADGTLLVLDGAANLPRRFAASGAPLGDVGRTGAGPGEFRMPRWAGRCGATAWFWDLQAQRLTGVDAGGRITAGPVFGGAPEGVRPFDVRCLPAGGFAVHGGLRPGEPTEVPGVRRSAVTLLLADAAGKVVRSDLVSDGGEVVQIGGGGGPRPLSGTFMMAASRDEVRYGTGATASFQRARPAGAPIAVPLPLPARPVTRAMAEPALEELLDLFPGPVRDRVRPAYAAVPLPAQAPFYRGMVVDEAGLIWLETSLPGEATTRWVVVGDDGEAVTTLSLPGRLVLFEVGRDYLLARQVRESGEERLVLHRLTRGR